MAKKTSETKTRISPKQRFEAYKTLALNTLRAVMSPKTRQFADLTSHEMVNGVLKPNTVQVSELISITQTAQALGNTVRLGYDGQRSESPTHSHLCRECQSARECVSVQ